MKTQEEKLRLFYEAINTYASEQRLKILYDADKQSGEALEQAESEALSESYETLRRKTAALRAELAGELAKKELDQKRALLQKRCELEESVFADARKALAAFAASQGYRDYLSSCAATAAAALGECRKGAKIFIRSKDSIYSEELKRAFAAPCEILTDESIKLGGIKLRGTEKPVMLDLTLEARLEEQREWFRENAGLTLS